MIPMRPIQALAVVVAVAVTGVAAQEARVSETARLEKMTARFAPTSVRADLSKLSAADKRVLAKLVEASKIIDALFLRQVWAGNEAMLLDLARDTTPEGRARLHYFLVNKGPWSRLDHDAVVRPGRAAQTGGRQFLSRWRDARPSSSDGSQSLPEAERAKATGFFTTIRRSAAAAFSSVPYSVEYQNELVRAAALLREAAALAAEPTLKTFLTKRADAFLSNDYYDSDVAWMELKGTIEPTIGPYEVYEDELFNYKAAFESFITRARRSRVREAAEVLAASCRTSRITCRSIRSTATRSSARLAPIVVVNEIFAAGDANRGVQTAAFNLPNDERVTRKRARSA